MGKRAVQLPVFASYSQGMWKCVCTNPCNGQSGTLHKHCVNCNSLNRKRSFFFFFSLMQREVAVETFKTFKYLKTI